MANPGSAMQNPRSSHVATVLLSAGSLVRRGGKELYEIPVALTGSWVKGDHRFSITRDDLLAIVRNFEKRKNEQIVIDYEHASEQPEIAKGGPIPAAGWIHQLTLTPHPSPNGRGQGGEGTLLALIEWTQQARQLIQGGQYRFFSPAIDWGCVDKETGQPQGATLTSGALTNHPFLEELPPIMLTDLSSELSVMSSKSSELRTQNSDVSTGYLDQPLKSISVGYGGRMKRLTLKKIGDGERAGHHGVFDGDQAVGYVDDSEFSEYCREHLGIPSAGTVDEPVEQVLTELLCESGIQDLESATPVRAQVKSLFGRLASLEAQGREAAGRNLLLSDAVRDGVLDGAKARALAREKRITIDDYIAVQEAGRAVDQAVARGKILPRDRAFFLRDAVERPREFARFVEQAVTVVPLTALGLGSTEQLPVDKEVDLNVRRLMSEKNLGYAKAMKLLFAENPALEARYHAEHSKPLVEAPSKFEPPEGGITQ